MQGADSAKMTRKVYYFLRKKDKIGNLGSVIGVCMLSQRYLGASASKFRLFRKMIPSASRACRKLIKHLHDSRYRIIRGSTKIVAMDLFIKEIHM